MQSVKRLCKKTSECLLPDTWLKWTIRRTTGVTEARTQITFLKCLEELFADLEGGGFQLQQSRIYQPDRLSRLLLAVSWRISG